MRSHITVQRDYPCQANINRVTVISPSVRTRMINFMNTSSQYTEIPQLTLMGSKLQAPQAPLTNEVPEIRHDTFNSW